MMRRAVTVFSTGAGGFIRWSLGSCRRGGGWGRRLRTGDLAGRQGEGRIGEVKGRGFSLFDVGWNRGPLRGSGIGLLAMILGMLFRLHTDATSSIVSKWFPPDHPHVSKPRQNSKAITIATASLYVYFYVMLQALLTASSTTS